MEPLFHFFIAACEVTFMLSDGETHTTRVNSMVKSDNLTLNVQHLGRTQQAAQIQVGNVMQDKNINFLNVVFLSINYLGHMTDKEFHTPEVVGHA